MSMLDKNGFKRKRYADIVASLENRAKEKMGESTNLSPKQFLGIFLRVIAWILSLFAQDLEDTYNAAFVETSEGIALNRNAKRQSARRMQPLRSTGSIEITGEEDTVVDSGFVVETSRSIRFRTTESVTISSGGTVTADIEAAERGQQGNVNAGDITEIVNPSPGIDSVTNPEATSGGRDRESDEELRERLDRTRSEENRLVFNLLDVTGVRDVYLDSNETNTTSDGIPPKSIEPVVWGGAEQDVVETIMRYKSGGIQSFGDTQVTVQDSKGRDQAIGYSRPNIVDVYVNITLSGSADQDAIRANIIEYIGGQDADGTEYDGLGIKEDVIAFQALMSAGRDSSAEDITIELSTDGSTYSYDNITINQREYARTDADKVVFQ
ncbi:baseplate J/gp47 family protein [Salibacterium qingdaonense]|uniref:Baseplate J-like protein n=1 Tax=Salibacterium qingdaonense TaxID=266892 RepID=A0A1I4KR67_9BACI|nr:baseplate J/gp47 family protein [Salibacterium qingdaonense]SFL81039.1 Baseplate J-like protein [Salibacterium qingdaonense]